MIYLSEFKEKDPKDLSELIKTLFSYSNPHDTSYIKNVCTYFDKDCIKLQCYSGRNRSFEDILEIVNTYFKDKYSITDIFKELILPIKKNNKIYSPYLISCSDIRRIVIYYYNNNRSIRDIYLTSSNIRYNSNNSWKELFKMIGINNIEDCKNYKYER